MADSTLVGMGLKLEDVGGRRRIGALDHGGILADLRDAGVPLRQRAWLSCQPLDSFDRILLARGDHDGKYEGALLVQWRTDGETPFLVVEAVSGDAAPRDEALLKRMLSYLMLRFDTVAERPVALFARTRNPMLCRVLRTMSRAIGGAGFYPEADSSVISLAAATLAHRMARLVGPGRRFGETRQALRGDTGAFADGPMLAMLDLRFIAEDMLDEDARRLFRDRLPRSAMRPATAPVRPLPATHEDKLPRIPAHIAAGALRAAPAMPVPRQ